MNSDRDQDEEDKQRPDDLNQQLDLRKEDKRMMICVNQMNKRKHFGKQKLTKTNELIIF